MKSRKKKTNPDREGRTRVYISPLLYISPTTNHQEHYVKRHLQKYRGENESINILLSCKISPTFKTAQQTKLKRKHAIRGEPPHIISPLPYEQLQ